MQMGSLQPDGLLVKTLWTVAVDGSSVHAQRYPPRSRMYMIESVDRHPIGASPLIPEWSGLRLRLGYRVGCVSTYSEDGRD